MVMAGGIAAAVVITMVGVGVVAITTAGRAVGIAVGIKPYTRKPYTRRGRLSWRPLSFPAPQTPSRRSALPNQLRSRGYVVTEIGEGERILPAAIFTGA
jgi:hypothetical protein